MKTLERDRREAVSFRNFKNSLLLEYAAEAECNLKEILTFVQAIKVFPHRSSHKTLPDFTAIEETEHLITT